MISVPCDCRRMLLAYCVASLLILPHTEATLGVLSVAVGEKCVTSAPAVS